MDIGKNNSVLMTIKVWVPIYKQREFIQACMEIIPNSRGEEGCLGYFLQKDLTVDNLYYLIMEWQSRENIESYVRSQDFGALLGAAKVLGNDIDIRISTLNDTGGMDTIKKIRQVSE